MGANCSEPISKHALVVATKHMHSFFKDRAININLVLYILPICLDHDFCNHPCVKESTSANWEFDQDYSKYDTLLIVLENSDPVGDIMESWLNYDNSRFLIIVGHMDNFILMHERWKDIYRRPIESPGCMLGCPREIAIFVKR